MIPVAPGVKVATSVGPGPESRLRPYRREVIPKEVKNKKRPQAGIVPQVPGATYTPAAAG